jgi:GAF domain-containing protein
VRDGRLEIQANIGEATRSIAVDRSSIVGACVLRGRLIHIPDLALAAKEFPHVRGAGLKHGFRSGVYAPLLRDGKAIGTISVRRRKPNAFSDKDVELLETFAGQAVIAIENARLFNETREALDQQRATAEVMGAISGSISDTQPVFDRILESCERLFAGRMVGINVLGADGLLHLGAYRGEGRERFERIFPLPADEGSGSGAAIVRGRVVHYPDVEGDATVPPPTREGCSALGIKSVIFAPMLSEEGSIGAIFVGRRFAVPFTDKEIELLKSFANQAAIGIKNVRLFNETREALERQTATAEILRVIASSPSDVQPVFDAIAASARRLLDANAANVTRRAGDMLELAAYTSTGEVADAELRKLFPARITGQGHLGQAVLSGAPVGISDILNDERYSEAFRASVRARGLRSLVSVPMMREGEAIGVISVNRTVPGKFSDHQTNLLKTFADQAVIAIENVRLFNETKEALERQTATAEILKVISSSPTDTQPVFDAIVKSAARLFGRRATLRLVEADGLRRRAVSDPESVQGQGEELMPIDTDSLTGRVVLERKAMQVVDTRGPDAPPFAKMHAHKWNFRSNAAAPLIRDGKSIGVISVNAPDPGALSDKQMALLATFADQAVIAIENVRLFKELQQRIGQMTALREVGQAVGSTLDLETVLKTIVSRALQLTGLDAGVIYEYDEAADQFQLRASENFDEEGVAALRSSAIRKGEGAVGTSVVTREPVQVPDTHVPDYPLRLRELLDRFSYRALLAVPLLREEQIIGALTMFRRAPGAFAPEAVELLKTFGTQSAMAIQNARLFREIADKGKQLEVASHHKSQFLASMSHELRTPLNAILGFNEMILDQVYGEISPDVKAPLENMQTSGKHLLRLINNVLDLAKIEAGRMELAISDYSVQDTVSSVHSTLKPLAAEKGLEFVADVPQDIPLAHGDGGRIAQCLMNLAGNSLKFTKAGRVTMAVAQNDGLLRYSVADTGIGIPADKIGSLFTEFKQTDATIASEYGGTGLGLSITKKFIEMHGGRIWVESEPGRGSTFLFEVPLRVNP